MGASSSASDSLAPPVRRRRLVSLTPMIDVVFLLLIFFMLASRFAVETRLELAPAGSGGGYQGPPRLVSVQSEGVALNGAPLPLADLPAALDALAADRTQIVVLQPQDNADVQDLVGVIDALRGAGFTRLALVE
ncbi:MAG: biopolymer transporter ExbD [Pseudomonadota bacterium]